MCPGITCWKHLKCALKCNFNVLTGHIVVAFKMSPTIFTPMYLVLPPDNIWNTSEEHCDYICKVFTMCPAITYWTHLKCAPKCYFNVFAGHIGAAFKVSSTIFTPMCPILPPDNIWNTSAEHCDSICKVFTMCPVVTCWMHLKCAPKCYFNVFTGHIAAVFKMFSTVFTPMYSILPPDNIWSTSAEHWKHIEKQSKYQTHFECDRCFNVPPMFCQCAPNVIRG